MYSVFICVCVCTRARRPEPRPSGPVGFHIFRSKDKQNRHKPEHETPSGCLRQRQSYLARAYVRPRRLCDAKPPHVFDGDELSPPVFCLIWRWGVAINLQLASWQNIRSHQSVFVIIPACLGKRSVRWLSRQVGRLLSWTHELPRSPDWSFLIRHAPIRMNKQ